MQSVQEVDGPLTRWWKEHKDDPMPTDITKVIKPQPEVMLSRATFEDLVERSGMTVDGYIDGRPQFSETTKTFTVASLRAEVAALKSENGKLRDQVAKMKGGKPAKTEPVKVPDANAWQKASSRQIADELGRQAREQMDKEVADLLGIARKGAVAEGVAIEDAFPDDPNVSDADNEAARKIMDWGKNDLIIQKMIEAVKELGPVPPGTYIVHPSVFDVERLK